jgi:hypothetical protein
LLARCPVSCASTSATLNRYLLELPHREVQVFREWLSEMADDER